MKTTNQLRQIVIYRTEDRYDCDICGCSGEDEESYHTFYGGEQLGVHVGCGPLNTTYVDVLEMVLLKLGYEIKVVDCNEQA